MTQEKKLDQEKEEDVEGQDEDAVLVWMNEAEKHPLASQWGVVETLEIQQLEALQEAEQKKQKQAWEQEL